MKSVFVLPEPDAYGNFFFNENHTLGPVLFHSGREATLGSFYMIDAANDIVIQNGDIRYFKTAQEGVDFLNTQSK